MRKVIITLCFLLAAFMAQAGRISGINIQSAGEAILVFMDGEQICTPTETCFIANYSGRHRIEVYAARYIPRTGQSVKGDLLFQEWVSNPGMNIRDIRVGRDNRPDFCPDRPDYPDRPSRPGYGYDVVMNRAEFDRFLRTVKDKPFDSDRNKLIETTLVSTGFTSDQCLQLVKLFSFDSEKIKLMQAMYPRIVDKPNFYLVIESLTFQSDKNKMNEFVRKYHSQRN